MHHPLKKPMLWYNHKTELGDSAVRLQNIFYIGQVLS